MYIDVRGLVIRAEKKGENGKYLTVLTPTHGVIGVNVRGGIRTASRFFASTQLYALSDMTVFYRNGHYSLTEASPVDVFLNSTAALPGCLLPAGCVMRQLQAAPRRRNRAKYFGCCSTHFGI